MYRVPDLSNNKEFLVKRGRREDFRVYDHNPRLRYRGNLIIVQRRHEDRQSRASTVL